MSVGNLVAPAPWPRRGASRPRLTFERISATAAQMGRGLSLGSLAFLAVHVPLALAVSRLPQLATAHALATFAIGALTALFGPIHAVLYVCAYIMGGEVLWRAGYANVFWEFGKYATAGILLIVLLRGRPRRWPLLPLLYFVLLMPSVVLSVLASGLAAARDQVSFNMSGPFTLALCVWIASYVEFRPEHWRKLLIAALGPITGLAAIALWATISAVGLEFNTESNHVTSGGFGPNQVSSLLGLGALIAFLTVIDRSASLVLRVSMLVFVITFGAQAALTFSRGGVIGAVIAASMGVLFLLRDARSVFTMVLALAVLAGAAAYVAPRLDTFTGGALGERFGNRNLTGRDKLARQDLEIWREHPILGTGPGGSKQARGPRGLYAAPAHTELTRMLAEHGIFGFGSLVALLVMSIGRLRRADRGLERALAASLICWSLLYMMHAAMRTVSPAFIFGLAFARLPGAPLSRRSGRRHWRRPQVDAVSGPQSLMTTNTLKVGAMVGGCAQPTPYGSAGRRAARGMEMLPPPNEPVVAGAPK